MIARREQMQIGRALLRLAETGYNQGLEGIQRYNPTPGLQVYKIECVPQGYAEAGWVAGLLDVEVWREDDGSITFET